MMIFIIIMDPNLLKKMLMVLETIIGLLQLITAYTQEHHI